MSGSEMNDRELHELGSEPGGAGGFTRREFLQAAGVSAVGAVVFTGCQPPTRELQGQSRLLLAEDTLSAWENWYASTCRECDAGCGTIVRVLEGRSKKIEGNPDHPVNRGKLCARGQATVQEQYHPDRLAGPAQRVGSSKQTESTTWEAGLAALAGKLREAQQQGRAGDVVFITPPLRGHQAILIQRFVAAYGAQWMVFDPFGEAPLAEASKRVFGQDRIPEFDVQRARYVLSFGADFLGTWLSPVHYGVEYGTFRHGSYRAGQFQPRQGRPRGYLTHVEPRFSMTAANADTWLSPRPGSEGILALGIANVILGDDRLPADAEGARAFDRSALARYTLAAVAQQTGIAQDKIEQVARDFATKRPSVAIGGGAAGSHSNGTEALAAILGLNLLVGAVGRDGGVRFNPVPPIEGAEGPRPASLTQWQDLTQRLRDRRVQAVLVYGANPVHGLPADLKFGDALKNAPFIASFSSFFDETTAMASLMLPSHLPLEDWGSDVPQPGPGFQVVSLQQPVVKPAQNTRSVWDVLLGLGRELGGRVSQDLPWATYREAIRAGARTLQQERRGSVQDPDFERFWLQALQRGGWWDESRTGSGAPTAQNLGGGFRPAEFSGDERTYPYQLVVFPHQTLGDGDTAHLPWLQGTPDPVTTIAWQTWVELNPKTAAALSLREGDIVEVESQQGKVRAPVYLHPAAAPGILAMPLGQGHTGYGRWAEKRGANPLDLLAPVTDQATGALAYGATRVRIKATGQKLKLAKFEGTANVGPTKGVVQVPGAEVVKVTPNDS